MTAIASSSNAAPPLSKYLASTEKKTRDKAIKTLSVFLSDESRDEIPKFEMTKLWKGIFYCFWMSDKPLVQQALASELADLVLTTPNTSSALSFLNGFWETVVREWNGIDRLRLDKYLMLVRRFVNVSFRLLLRNDWDLKTCQDYNAILTNEGGPLCPTDGRVSVGLVYHIADVYLEELEKVLRSSDTDTSKPVPLVTLLSPFFILAARTPLGTTFNHLQSSLIEPLLSSYEDDPRARKRRRVDTSSQDTYPSILSNACLDDASVEVKLSTNLLRKKILRRLFEVASHAETRDANRRKLYALWKAEKEDDDVSDEE
ncbi:Nop52-domain-containing protein [Gymnopus androsaceus JB14]|uniref:Nop52-domain-containing protein n=1 Tax=Gymnopus androsaceus JB14 TaxID=1447944 RepID=A0A6A4HI39_9AGAR|nr:Nop52-domain-containing protein [Gymnopus androsaceus JB14]